MKRFAFESKYQIESTSCTRCSGSGRNPRGRGRDSAYYSSECYNCKGLGWKPTPAGRDLFYDVCAIAGVSVTAWPTRIDPYLIWGKKLSEQRLEEIQQYLERHVSRGAIIAPAPAKVR